ncbi:MAG TPA: hypothetical protein DHW07_03125 [Gammaproteobacteria bacterium]|nr:hypothetical protein [Gammaproteobacteria bacterium]
MLIAILVTTLTAVAFYIYSVSLSFWAQVLILVAILVASFAVIFYGKAVLISVYRAIKTWWNKPNLRSDLLVLRRMTRRLFRRNSLYDIPIFVLLTKDIEKEAECLGKLGLSLLDRFSRNSPVQYWVGHESVVITLDWGSSNAYPNLARDLGRSLRKIRPRQPLNGVILNVDCELLVDDSDSRAHEFAELSKEQLLRFVRGAHITAPVYTIVSGMSSLADFCQFFSTASESVCDSPLGSLVQQDPSGHFDPSEFDAAYASVLQKFAGSRNTSLLSQLDPDYRVSIAAAPLQMLMLKPVLNRFLTELSRASDRERPVWIRGIYFLDSVAGREPKDLLSGAAAGAMGLRFTRPARQIPSARALFTRNLFRNALRADSQAIGVRRGPDIAAKVGAAGAITGWLAVLGFMVWSVNEETVFKSKEFQTAINAASTYREKIKTLSPQGLANSPDEIIDVLGILRASTFAEYQKSRLATSFWIPNDSVRDQVQAMYQTELGRFALPMLAEKQYQILRDYEKNPTVREVARAFRASAIYVDLALSENPSGLILRNNADEVVRFFLEQFENLTGPQKITLGRIIQDIDMMSYGKTDLAKQIQRSAAKELSRFGLEQICYQLIRTAPINSQMVELGDALRANFDVVYTLNPQDGYFRFEKTSESLLRVPYLFTRDGFEFLDLSTFSNHIRHAIEYVGVIDPRVAAKISEQELENIAADIRNLYTRDYIDTWNGILASAAVRQAANAGQLQELLAAASSATTSPLAQLMSMTSTHTKLFTPPLDQKGKPNSSKSKGVKAPSSVTKLLKLEKKAQTSEKAREALKQAQKESSAKAITQAFAAFHKLLDPAAKETEVAKLMGNLHSLNQWVQPFVGSSEGGRDILEAWKKPAANGTNPIARMRLRADDYPQVIKGWLVNLSTNANSLLIGVAHQWLSRHWQSQVVEEFNQSLAARFPFDSTSNAESDLDRFTAFFKSGGVVDSFVAKWISPFRFGPTGSGLAPSFLWDDGLKLDPSLREFLAATSTIRDTLFDPTGIRPEMDFEVRVDEMPIDLTEFSIRSTAPLLVYRHGPSLWRPQVWPIGGDALRLRAFKGLALSEEKKIPGAWSWFRILAHAAPMAEGRQIPVNVQVGDSSVKATIKLLGPQNPFDLTLYSRYQPPGTI